jgi:two-component system, cell cycle sensor histidine kinase and response regulator CckA
MLKEENILLEVYQENQEKIDLVLLDLAMPKMGGFEVLEKIKAINPLVKVIMSSGFSAQDGVKAFVPKPYQAKYLARTVREVLDKEK